MYKPELTSYKINFDKGDVDESKVLELLIDILGQPDNDFINACKIINLDSKESNIVGYQVHLTEEIIKVIKNRLGELGVNIGEKFIRDYGHFHITIYKEDVESNILLETEDEGIAYEKEDNSWDVYYIEGSLEEYLRVDGEYFIFNISNDEINSLEDIKERFKKWVDEHKERMK